MAADSCGMGGIWCVGTVDGAGVCGQTVEDGCDSLLMPVCGSVGDEEPLRGWSGQPWEHVLKTNCAVTGERNMSVNSLICPTRPCTMAWWLQRPTPTAEVPVRAPMEAKCYLSYLDCDG